MTRRDKIEFGDYLRACTDAQVRGVYEKGSRGRFEARVRRARLISQFVPMSRDKSRPDGVPSVSAGGPSECCGRGR